MSVRDFGNVAVSDYGAKETNPTTATVMADTEGVPYAGNYQVNVVVGASAVALFQVEHRNAANDATTAALILYAAAGQSGQYTWVLRLAAGERVRVMMNANLTGTAAASIQAEYLT